MRRRGFTLMEVLLAILLIGMLSGSVFAFLWSLVGRRDLLEGRSLEAQAGTAFIDRVESDVMCGLAGDDSAGAGVVGTATRLKLLTRGVWLPGRGEHASGGDLQGSEYVFDAGKGELRGRRWSVGGAGPGDFEVISARVERVRLRYSDGTNWHDSFDSGSEGGLPVAIEVAVWFGAPAPGGTAAGAAEQTSGSEGLRPSATGRMREPDRLRVIVVPDGPESSWKEAR